MKSSGSILILLAILLLSAFFRVYHLANESIWLDEAISIRIAETGSLSLYKGKLSEPPLYTILLHWWIQLFGNSEFSVRFLSSIFGLCAVCVIYKVASMLFDKQAGILSSLLLGLSAFHIRYSQEARNYSLLSLLTLFSMYFFIKLLHKKSLPVLFGYAISGILLIYTHFFGLFIILAQNLYFFTLFVLSKKDCKINIKQWIWLELTLGIAMIPYLILLSYWISKTRNIAFWQIPKPVFISIPVSFLGYSGSFALMAVFFILSCFSIVKYKKIGGVLSNYFLLIWLFVPIILLFLVSAFIFPVYLTRNTIAASPAFYILAANGIQNLRPRFTKLAVIVIVIILSLLSLQGYYGKAHKERWREVARYLDTHSKTQDLILFCSGVCRMPFEYYSKKDGLIKKGLFGVHDIVDQGNIQSLLEATKGQNRVWVVISHSNDPKGLIKKALSRHYILSYYKPYISAKYLNLALGHLIDNDYTGIEVCLFEKK